jgi:hypothetical protein
MWYPVAPGHLTDDIEDCAATGLPRRRATGPPPQGRAGQGGGEQEW